MALWGAVTEKVVSKMMNIPDENGFEAWRKLATGKEPRTGNHQVAAMQALMNYTVEGGIESFDDNVEEFKQHAARFEHRFSAVVDDTVMQAVLKNNAPQEIRDKVELETYDSFASSAIASYNRSYGASMATPGPAPREEWREGGERENERELSLIHI